MGSYLSTESPSDSTDEPSSSKSSGYHHPTPEDVFDVRRLLLAFVPPELATLILDVAEYWPRLAERNNEPLDVPSTVGAQWYLITPPVPTLHELLPEGSEEEAESVSVRVRRVRFWTKSCDQGWGGEEGLTRPYHGSWTWFEAAILRPRQGPPADADAEPQLNSEFPAMRELAAWGLQLVPNPADGQPTWHLQRNARASKEAKEHGIVWDEEDIEEKEGEKEEFDLDTGSSRGKGFVCAIEPGDRVGILARAQFPEWKNRVKEAQVEIFYSV